MTRPESRGDRLPQPALSELFSDYLRRQVARQGAGLGSVETTGEVVPFEAVPVQPVDAQLAWEEAVAVGRWYPSQEPLPVWSAPPDWPSLVAGQEPTSALAMSFGNYPQLVQNLQDLLQPTDLARLRPRAERAPSVPGLREWATSTVPQSPPQLLLAVGVLRLAKQFDEAASLLQRGREKLGAAWEPAWANEEAALAWHRGQVEQAVQLWQQQPPSVPVLFNRGMAALFLGDGAVARAALREAVAPLADTDGWQHLGQLYLTLAELHLNAA